MQFAGLELLNSNLQARIIELKLIANERAVCVFAASQQHRDVNVLGLRYSDDYKGNALAAMLIVQCHVENGNDKKSDNAIDLQQSSLEPARRTARLEFRHHAGFSDNRVIEIAKKFYQEALKLGLLQMTLIYQGKTLQIWGE